ncbi:MAG: Spy/CpxP family protein refolding chaperone [Pseudomonadota bacterium]
MKRVIKIVIVTVITATTIGGIVYANDGCGMYSPQRIVKELNLSDVQQENFQAVIEQFRTARKEMRQHRERRRDEMLSLLNADILDQAKALGVIEEKASAVRDKAPDMIATIANFTDSLTPEQRQQLREHISDRMDFMHERMGYFGPGGGLRE